jgi:hypothetical protein
METILLILLASVTLYTGFIYSLRRKIRRRTAEIATQFTGGDVLLITPSANFFGLESKGMRQARGSGMLVLTRDRLYFEMYVPRRITDIRLSAISAIETPGSHLGKTKMTPLLKVFYSNANNQPDSAAWLVKDLEKWRRVLQDLTGIGESDATDASS